MPHLEPISYTDVSSYTPLSSDVSQHYFGCYRMSQAGNNQNLFSLSLNFIKLSEEYSTQRVSQQEDVSVHNPTPPSVQPSRKPMADYVSFPPSLSMFSLVAHELPDISNSGNSIQSMFQQEGVSANTPSLPIDYLHSGRSFYYPDSAQHSSGYGSNSWNSISAIYSSFSSPSSIASPDIIPTFPPTIAPITVSINHSTITDYPIASPIFSPTVIPTPNPGGSPSHKTDAGAIAGGVIGGVIALCIILYGTSRMGLFNVASAHSTSNDTSNNATTTMENGGSAVDIQDIIVRDQAGVILGDTPQSSRVSAANNAGRVVVNNNLSRI